MSFCTDMANESVRFDSSQDSFHGASQSSQNGGSSQDTEPYFGSDDEGAIGQDDSQEPEPVVESKQEQPPAKRHKAAAPDQRRPQPPLRRANANGRIGKSKEWFLTYPQCNMSPERVMKHITNRWEVVYACVAQELHESGDKHIHAFIQFKEAHQFSGKGVLDQLAGKHGNYQVVKLRNKCVEYVKKGGVFIEHGEFSTGDVYADAMSKSSFDLSMSHIKANKPRDYVIYHNQISSTMAKIHPPPPPIYLPPSNYRPFVAPSSLLEWLDTESRLSTRARCLVLLGDSRLGKTSWCRAMFPQAMYFRGMFSLSEWNDAAPALIFDDCSDLSEKSFDFRKSVLTQMGECFLSDKYMKKVKVNVCMPAIVIANDVDDIKWLNSEKEQKYWSVNAFIVTLTEPLFE